ncbi:hypothetical protein C8J56DRAFT_935066 [Mycena floridula]|nr:hypothetical protein C8J56DRAFT_935066 [Mycena floridula]
MSDDDAADDYLSDKFLVGDSTSAPKTYSQIRKEAQQKAKLRDAQNKQKSRRQQELESREEGLSKSLFARAKEEEESGLGSGNKALSIMMKMGFQPGQALGKADDVAVPVVPSEQMPESSKQEHKAEPLPLNEWEGRKGIGLVRVRKRAHSPSAEERVIKMAKLAAASHEDFRDRTRQLYDSRRAEGKLGSAQRTCASLDEKAGKSFNVLWLNAQDESTFPPGLTDAIALHTDLQLPSLEIRPLEGEAARLRRKMQSEMLSSDIDEATEAPVIDHEAYLDVLEETVQFLRLQAQDRLALVLSYLRDHYAYCFWCGTQYDTLEDMEAQCPGPDEEAHD